MEMTRKTLLGGVAFAAIAASIAAAPVAAAAPALTATVTDGTLRIVGGPSSEKIALRVSSVDRTQLQVDVGNDGSADRTFDLALTLEYLEADFYDQVAKRGLFKEDDLALIKQIGGDDTPGRGAAKFEVLVGGSRRLTSEGDGNGGAGWVMLLGPG